MGDSEGTLFIPERMKLLPGSCSLQHRITFKFKVPPAEFQATEYAWISELKPWTCRLQIRKTQETVFCRLWGNTEEKMHLTVQDFYCGITSYLQLVLSCPPTELPGPLPTASGDELPGNPATVFATTEALFPSLFLALACYPSKHLGLLKP